MATRRTLLLCQARSLRAKSGGPRRIPGQGGKSEEKHIAQAIRTIRNRKPRMVMEVMNACHVSVAPKLLPNVFRRDTAPQIWIRVLTHADLLSDDALQYQMQRASTLFENRSSTTDVAVIAMDLHNAESLKSKKLNPVRHVIVGANKKTVPGGGESMVVCGLPNAGKSSLIHALTKDRTLQVKKKKSYHLPKISATAGRTLGTKNHAFNIGKKTYSLTDTPGLRPQAEMLNVWDTASLLATGSMQATKGMLSDDELRQCIVTILWRALKRHADLSSTCIAFGSPDELWDAHRNSFESSKVQGTVGLLQHLMLYCRQGSYGGLVIENEPKRQLSYKDDSSSPFRPSRGSPIVAMNEAATLLRDIGAGVKDGLATAKQTRTHSDTKCKETTTSSFRNNVPVMENIDGQSHFSKTKQKGTNIYRVQNVDKPSKNLNTSEVVRLPEYQHDIRCLKCAGFVRGDNNGRIFGTRFTKVMRWDDHDIRSFYSRVAEAFGVSLTFLSHKRYLLKDSLACTFANKYKLRSRRQTYNKLSKDLGGFPVPNDQRPHRFRNEQPVPLKIVCTNRSKEACQNRHAKDSSDPRTTNKQP